MNCALQIIHSNFQLKKVKFINYVMNNQLFLFKIHHLSISIQNVNIYFYTEVSRFDNMRDGNFNGTLNVDPKLKDVKNTLRMFRFYDAFKIDAGNNK